MARGLLAAQVIVIVIVSLWRFRPRVSVSVAALGDGAPRTQLGLLDDFDLWFNIVEP